MKNEPKKYQQIAVIQEAECIGCTKCIQACPVDAIIGASKQMHTIVADWCTGCELCLPPCPVDCITLEPLTTQTDIERATREAQGEVRANLHHQRIEKHACPDREATEPAIFVVPSLPSRQQDIQAALARVRAKQGSKS